MVKSENCKETRSVKGEVTGVMGPISPDTSPFLIRGALSFTIFVFICS